MKQFLFVLAAVVSWNVSANILFNGSFESGQIFIMDENRSHDSFYYGAMGADCKPSTREYDSKGDNRVVTEPVRYGKYANAQTVRYDCDYRPFNGGTLQKPRQSLKVVPKIQSMFEGKEYWIAFSFMLDKDWVSDYSKNRDNIFQLVKENTSTANGARETGPNIVNIEEYEGQFVLGIIDEGGSSGQKDVFKWDTQAGKWQDIVINMRTCRIGKPGCDGFLKVYLGNEDRRAAGIHKKPVYSSTGPNSRGDVHTVAVNLYKYAWHCTGDTRYDYEACMKHPNPTRSTKPRTIFFDEIMIGDANSGFEAVAPYFSENAAADTITSKPSAPLDLIIE